MDDTTPLHEAIELEHDDEAGVARFQYDWSRDESLSTLVAIGVGAVANVDPLDLEPLQAVIDPDALDELFAPTEDGPSRNTGTVAFSLSGHQVVVDARGEVEIQLPD